jgi:hypothetical protein
MVIPSRHGTASGRGWTWLGSGRLSNYRHCILSRRKEAFRALFPGHPDAGSYGWPSPSSQALGSRCGASARPGQTGARRFDRAIVNLSMGPSIGSATW